MTLDTDMNQIQQTQEAAPSSIIWITGLPDDDDDGELEMRLARIGDLLKLERDGEKAIATFKNTRAAVEAREKLSGFIMASSKVISLAYAPDPRRGLSEIDAITGEFVRSNRELHWKIGQLVRSTYSAMRSTNGNYPPPKQTLIPEDFKYMAVINEPQQMESHWSVSMSMEDKLKDYNEFADHRPFHNRYVIVTVQGGSAHSTAELHKYVQSIIGEVNLVETSEFSHHSLVHFTLKSTRDAAIVLSALNTSLKTGEGGLVGIVEISSVKYGPPKNTANAVGKLWFGCSAFLAVDEEKLKHMISLFGEIESFRLVKSKNCLFVSFKTEHEALACRNKLFAYELAPGHFLNVDFAPEIPAEGTNKRRISADLTATSIEEIPPKRHAEERSIRLELSKMGEKMCAVLARKFFVQRASDTSDKDFYLPRDIDICNRTKVDYCKAHLAKVGVNGPLVLGSSSTSDLGTVVVWQFAAATERDCNGYDSLCDYFVSKDRIGFFTSSDGAIVTYFIPPVKQFLEPLGLPMDAKYLTAIQMPASGQVASTAPPQ